MIGYLVLMLLIVSNLHTGSLFEENNLRTGIQPRGVANETTRGQKLSYIFILLAWDHVALQMKGHVDKNFYIPLFYWHGMLL